MNIHVGLDTSALDPLFKEHAARGIGRYVRSLKAYFDSHCSSGDSVSTQPIQVEYFDHTWFALPSGIERAVEALPCGRQTVRQQLCYPLQLKGQALAHLDVLHFPAHMDAPSWNVRPTIVTVLDLIPLLFASLYQSNQGHLRFRLARWLENRAMRVASHIIAISECTKRDVMRILGVDEHAISVTHLGVDTHFLSSRPQDSCDAVREKYGLPPHRPLVLYVGGIDERKNIGVLLRVFDAACRGSQETDGSSGVMNARPLLVLAGNIKSHPRFKEVLSLAKELQMNDEDIRFIGFVDDGELPHLLQSSSVFLFPSLYEGFGLPPLEALASGAVVVSSNSSAMPEVLGEHALYFEPSDIEEGARQLVAGLRRAHSKEADEYIASGRAWASRFSWERTGQATLAAYTRCADSVRLVK